MSTIQMYAYPVMEDMEKHFAKAKRFKVSNDDSPPEICKYSLMVPGSTGDVKPAASASATLHSQCIRIMDLQGNDIPDQYLGASPGFDYLVDCLPVGGVTFVIQEDALVTPVPDASLLYYFDLIVNAISRPGYKSLERYSAHPNIKADSTSFNASPTNLLMQSLGLARNNKAAYSATASASPRLLRCQVISGNADFSV